MKYWKRTAYAICLLLCAAGSAEAKPRAGFAWPVGVTAKLHLLKIYDINTVTETYSVDGFLTLMWKDPAHKPRYEPLFLLDDGAVGDLFRNEAWWPNLILINALGQRHVPYRRVLRDTAGNMTYTERFYATISSDMDFQRFPFDRQRLQLTLESFGFNDSILYFVRPAGSVLNIGDVSIPEWTVMGSKAGTGRYRYNTHLRRGASFDRFSIEVDLKRKPEYYIWQFFLPLGLLMLLSWFIFWIGSAEVQISLAFTLILTLVAYNFYSASYLPRLPYNTFIQSTVIAAYIVIFLLTGFVVLKYSFLSNGKTETAVRIDRLMKWLVPVITLVALGWIWVYFFG